MITNNLFITNILCVKSIYYSYHLTPTYLIEEKICFNISFKHFMKSKIVDLNIR